MDKNYVIYVFSGALCENVNIKQNSFFINVWLNIFFYSGKLNFKYSDIVI